MADKKFLYDAYGDIARVVHIDDMTGDLSVELIQDVEPLIELNKQLREQSRPGDAMNEGALGTLWGSVPAFVIEKADLEGWDINDWRKFLNDPDNAVFKTFYGRV